MKMKNSLKGVTLIELLVVMAIIAILSLIAYANLSGAREEAKITSLKTSMQSLIPAAEIHALRNAPQYNYEDFCETSEVNKVKALCINLFDEKCSGEMGCDCKYLDDFHNSWSITCMEYTCGNDGCQF